MNGHNIQTSTNKCMIKWHTFSSSLRQSLPEVGTERPTCKTESAAGLHSLPSNSVSFHPPWQLHISILWKQEQRKHVIIALTSDDHVRVAKQQNNLSHSQTLPFELSRLQIGYPFKRGQIPLWLLLIEKGCNEKPRIAIPRRNTEVPIPSSTVAIVFDGSRQNGGHFGEREKRSANHKE